jgi:7-cyano-7-deazaguanine reductase
MSLDHSPLGKPAAYRDTYAPELLFPIARHVQRAEIGLPDGAPLPFMGADLWTAFELSWLNPRGKPQLALAHVTVPCESPAIVESKSFKLYLNSFTMTPFDSAETVKARMVEDLSQAVGAHVGVKLVGPDDFDRETVAELDGLNLDRLDIDCTHYQPAPDLLKVDANEAPVSEVLTSRLLKSNCLVTGQPDWGSVQIGYTGHPIDQEGLLRYLVSFRQHNEFHEHCVERIFMDLWTRCRPTRLQVYARYTRRGGLDINPFRTSHPARLPANVRSARQ